MGLNGEGPDARIGDALRWVTRRLPGTTRNADRIEVVESRVQRPPPWADGVPALGQADDAASMNPSKPRTARTGRLCNEA